MNKFNYGHVDGTLIDVPRVEPWYEGYYVEFRIHAKDDATDGGFGSIQRQGCNVAVEVYMTASYYVRSHYENMKPGDSISCDYWVDSKAGRTCWFTHLRAAKVTVAGREYPMPRQSAQPVQGAAIPSTCGSDSKQHDGDDYEEEDGYGEDEYSRCYGEDDYDYDCRWSSDRDAQRCYEEFLPDDELDELASHGDPDARQELLDRGWEDQW